MAFFFFYARDLRYLYGETTKTNPKKTRRKKIQKKTCQVQEHKMCSSVVQVKFRSASSLV